MWERSSKGLLWVLTVMVFVLTQGAAEAAVAKRSTTTMAEVEGFKMKYKSVPTPESGWGAGKEGQWLQAFEGGLTTEKTLSYRKRTLAPGKHDVWIEKGKGEWYYLFIGDREDEEADRLRAMFKLYEQDMGVERLRVELKLTRRGKKLKFTVLAGQSEGHGNFKIVDSNAPKKD